MQHDFKYISKKDFQVAAAYDDLLLLLQEVRKELKDRYTFQHKLVGSYSRNMITYDAKSNVGFDFDVNIYPHDDDMEPEQIRRLFKKALDKHIKAHGFDYAEDSTRVLTIKVKDKKYARIVYSVDFAFVNDYTDDEGDDCQEYIRFNKKQGSYTWEEQPAGYYQLREKVDWIKEHGLWETELKPYYIKKKNANTDPNIHSRTTFAIAVHEICQKYGYYE